MFIFGTSIQSSLSSVPSTCGSVLEGDVNCQWHSLRTLFLSIPYKQGVTLPNSCSCQTQRSHSWFVYSRPPPEPQNKSKNIDRLRRVNHQKELVLFYKCNIHLTELIKDVEIALPGVLKFFEFFHKVQTVFAPLHCLTK